MGSRRQGVDLKETIAVKVVGGPSLVLSGSGSTPVFVRVAGRGLRSSVLRNGLSEDSSVERAMGTSM